jgi:hypothetical protein
MKVFRTRLFTEKGGQLKDSWNFEKKGGAYKQGSIVAHTLVLVPPATDATVLFPAAEGCKVMCGVEPLPGAWQPSVSRMNLPRDIAIEKINASPQKAISRPAGREFGRDL